MEAQRPAAPFVVQASGRAWRQSDAAPRRRTTSPTWVAAADLEGLVTAAREWGLDDGTVDLLEKRVKRLADSQGRPSAFSHVDRAPAGDLLMSTPTTWYDEEAVDVRTGEVTIVLSGSLVLAAETGEAHVINDAASRLLSGAPTPDSGPREVLAAMILTILGQAGEVELGLGEAVAATERLVFTPEREDPVERIYRLKREIAEARRAFGPIMAALPEFEAQAEEERRSAERAWAWLARVQVTVDRLDRHLSGHDELLGDMLQAHLAQVSVRQNEDMRKISAWAAMITVPTLIAGIYGMNFRHMPELSWLVGYPLVIALMAGVCWWLYRAFRKSGWL